jgi:2-dehydropantoate 2-reductase
MRIAMMGSGGIGGYLGAKLAQIGEDVTFIARGSHLAAMCEQGLCLESPLGGIKIPRVSATDRPSEVGFVDLVIFAVKLYDSESAAAAVMPMVGPKTKVVTLQNGIDSVATLAKHVPHQQIVPGATYISAAISSPGVIVHAGGNTQLLLGGRNDPVIEAFESACSRAGGIDVQIAEDIEKVLWIKFITVSAFSGATSLMRCGIGPILANPESRIFLEQLRDEGMAVAAAAGHKMAKGYEEKVTSLWKSFPAETKSSMAIDLEKGKPIEIEWLSGRVHTLGNELGVMTPAHTAVYRELHLHATGAPHLQ